MFQKFQPFQITVVKNRRQAFTGIFCGRDGRIQTVHTVTDTGLEFFCLFKQRKNGKHQPVYKQEYYGRKNDMMDPSGTFAG